MKTTGILFIVFFVLTSCLLLVIPLTAHKKVMTEEFGTNFTNDTQSGTTFNSVTVNTTMNVTSEVQTERTIPNRQMESVMDLNDTAQAQWTSVPGSFDTSFTTQVNISYTNFGQDIPLVKAGVHSSAPKVLASGDDDLYESYNLITKMNTYNMEWSANEAVVTYGRNYSYDGLPADNETVKVLNYPFISVYHQMNNMPGWQTTWQALAQMSYKMFNQNFQTAYYGANLFNVNFWNASYVMDNVLNSITDNVTEQALIYEDKQYGLNSVKAMNIWIASFMEVNDRETGWEHSPTQELIDHFDAMNIEITYTELEATFNSTSEFNVTIQELENKLWASKYFTNKPELTNTLLAAEQWAMGNLLNDEDTNLQNFTSYNSMNNLGMNFVISPEGAYNEDCNPGLDTTQVLTLFNQTDIANNNQTMLNPINVKWFYDALFQGDSQAADIMERFGFEDADQLACFVTYISVQADNSSPSQPEGTLNQRAIQLSFQDVEEVLPMQLASRTMAAYNTNMNLTCEGYMAPVAADDAQVLTVCGSYNFTDLYALQFFVNATWYGDYYKDLFLLETGLNETQYDTLFDNTSDENSFGGVLANVNQNNSIHFNCTDGDIIPTNCTSTQLAVKQWGSSIITLDPSIANEAYTATVMTMANWGDYLIEALPQAPEFGYYASQTHATNGTSPSLLNETQVASMFEYGYTWYGLNNTYNAKLFAQINSEEPVNWTGNQTAFLAGMQDQYGLDQAEMLLVYDTFTEMMTYITGGSYQFFKNVDLITGFASDMANKICNPYTESMIKGNAIYYNPIVTPSITNYFGPLSTQTFTVYTGKPLVDANDEGKTPGLIAAQNGINQPNYPINIWNGASLISTFELIQGASIFAESDAFDGLQNAPVYSGNSTDNDSSFIYDANNLRYINLTTSPDGDSYICANGTGETNCWDSEDRVATIFRENEPGLLILPVAVEQAYQMPVVTEQHDQISSDTHSGFTTNNKNWQILSVGVTGQDPQTMATLATLYVVNPEVYTDEVYPVDTTNPTKTITETHTVTTEVPVTTTTDTVEDTTTSKPQSVSTTVQTTDEKVKTTLVIILSILCIVFGFGACFSLFSCQKEEDEGHVASRNQKEGLIQENTTLADTMVD